MIKIILNALNSWRSGIMITLILGLLSWHYGGLYFANQSGKKEQQELIDKKNNDIITKQEKQNAKDNADVDATDVTTLRNSLPRRKADTDMSESPKADNLQRGSSERYGLDLSKGYGKTTESVESTYQRLCRQAGCEIPCRSIELDPEYGLIGDCNE